MKCMKKVVRTLLVVAALLTAMPTITVEANVNREVRVDTPTTAAEGGLEGFVTRLYSKVLGRTPDANGLKNWMNQIASGKKTVLEVSTNGFFHSQEFLKKNLSNGEFVKVCYRTFLGREAEQAGYNNWVKKLNSGATRDSILYGFAYSQEFKKIMSTFGVDGNKTTTTTAKATTNTNTTTTTTTKVTTINVTTPTNTTTTTTTKEGTAGLLTIPSVGVSVPLYSTTNCKDYQKVVDAENSALYTTFMGKKMIADHAHQGFSKMKNSKVGTVAYIQKGNTKQTLVCTAKYTNGVNKGNGIMIGNTYADQMKDGDLFMYTCNDSEGISVTVTFWKVQ